MEQNIYRKINAKIDLREGQIKKCARVKKGWCGGENRKVSANFIDIMINEYHVQKYIFYLLELGPI